MAANAIARQLANLEGYTQLVNAINRDLIERPPYNIGDLGGKLRVGGAAVGGGVAGGGLGFLAVALLISNPAGWVIAGAVAGGAILGGGVAGYFAHRHVQDCREQSRVISEQMQSLVDRTNEIQLSYAQGQPTSNLVNRLKGELMGSNYVSTWDAYAFELNDQKFQALKTWYSNDVRDQVVLNAKFLIVMSATMLPPNERPTDRLIVLLSHIVNNLASQPLANLGRLTMGMLYVYKQNISTAVEWFRAIPQNSDLHHAAQVALGTLQQQQPQLLGYN